MPRERKKAGEISVQPIWLSTSKAKEYLGCSDRFLKGLRDKGLISFSRFGNKMFWYKYESLNKFLEKNKVI